MDKRDHRLSAGAEIAAEAEVDACKQTVEDVAVHILSAGGDDALIRRKQADHGLGDKLGQDAYYDAEADRNTDGVPHGLLCTSVFPGTDVLCADGGYRREHRRRNEEQEAYELFDYADRGRVRQAAEICDNGYEDKRYLDKPVLKRNGHADAQYLPHNVAPGAKIAARDGNAPAADGDECNEHAQRLSKRCAQRRSYGAEVHRAHEQIVKRNVCRAGHRNEIHRTFAVAHAAENAAYDVVRGYERDADKAHGEVPRRAVHGLGRS